MNKWDKNVFERTENYSTISKKKEKSSSLLFIISDICFWDSEVQNLPIASLALVLPAIFCGMFYSSGLMAVNFFFTFYLFESLSYFKY